MNEFLADEEAVKVFICIGLLFLASCSSVEPKPHVVKANTLEVVSSSPSRSNLMIRHPLDRSVVCLGRGADTEFQSSDSLDLDLHFFSVGSGNVPDEQGSDSVSASESELAGRTPSVLQARELYYRTCEFIGNQDVSEEDALLLFREARDIISEAWKSEIQNYSNLKTILDSETLSKNDSPSIIQANGGSPK